MRLQPQVMWRVQGLRASGHVLLLALACQAASPALMRGLSLMTVHSWLQPVSCSPHAAP
jgi:hypothetical protein